MATNCFEIENFFSETMLSDAYTRMNTKEKDRIFMDFYQKNKSNIQHFLEKQFHRQFVKEIPIEFVNKQKQSPTDNEKSIEDPCRIS